MNRGHEIRFLVLLGCAECIWPGCKSVAQVDLECPSLCLAAPGPTLRGSGSLAPWWLDASAYGSSALDAGADGGVVPVPDAAAMPSSIDWEATLRFNDVVAQLPSGVLDISLDVRLTSVTLSSVLDLAFITGMRVFLGRPKTATADGGRSLPECWSRISTSPIAVYGRPIAPSGAAISLVNLVPEINLYNCLKDAPARFLVAMDIEPLSYPTSDVPLTLSTCVSAQTTASYP